MAPPKRLLFISNGHGEDSIAAEIVRRLPAAIEINAYPTLGDGRAYALSVLRVLATSSRIHSRKATIRGSSAVAWG